MNNKQVPEPVPVSKPHSAFTNLEDEINNRIQDGYEPIGGLIGRNKELIQVVEKKKNPTTEITQITYKIVPANPKDPPQAPNEADKEAQRRLTQEEVNKNLKDKIAELCKDGYSTLGDIVPVFEPNGVDYIYGCCFAYQAMIKKIRKSPSNFK